MLKRWDAARRLESVEATIEEHYVGGLKAFEAAWKKDAAAAFGGLLDRLGAVGMPGHRQSVWEVYWPQLDANGQYDIAWAFCKVCYAYERELKKRGADVFKLQESTL